MPNPSILSIGEAMVEFSRAQNDLWKLAIAGDTLNTAWYLRRLLPPDWSVNYLSRVGQGELSQKMVDFLSNEGIGAQHVGRDPQQEIGLYVISLKDGERSFTYWRNTSAAKRLADDPDLLNAALADTGVAYFSGITLAILPEAGRKSLVEALTKARKRDVLVVFDPNIRPQLWPDMAVMRDWMGIAASISDLILPSFDDEQAHFGDSDPAATIRRNLACGAVQVVVKTGGGPIHFGGRDGEGVITDLRRETPVDTTSAGDSFNAGYLSAWLRSASVEAAIRAGHAISSRVIQYPGALVPEAVPTS